MLCSYKPFSSAEITDGGQSWPCCVCLFRHVTFPVVDITTLFIKSQVFKIKNVSAFRPLGQSRLQIRLRRPVGSGSDWAPMSVKRYVFTRVDQSENICKLS